MDITRLTTRELELEVAEASDFLKHSANSLPCGEQDAIVDHIADLEAEVERRNNLSTPYGVSTEKRPNSLFEAIREAEDRWNNRTTS